MQETRPLADADGAPLRDVMALEARVAPPCVDVVIPVYNEAAVLDANIARLHAYLTDRFPFSWRITIVDNASTDATWFRATRMARDCAQVRAVHLDRKGRGFALKTAWSASDATVVAYMDVDLSTELGALLPLVAPLVSGHSDVAIGSRLSPGASVARGPKRELISRCYNALLRAAFATSVRDAQCGFKAVRADIARRLLPAIEDDGWFFDTELLLLAEHNGLRVHDVPVDWIDDPDTRVHVVGTALGDLRGSARMAWKFLTGQGRIDFAGVVRPPLRDDFGRALVTFGLIGAASTCISLMTFVLLRGAVGAVAANVGAVTVTFVANTWANARWSARVPRTPNWRGAFAVYLLSLAITSVALVAVEHAGGGLAAEVAVLALTWTAASIARLAVVRSWLRERSSR